MTNKTITLARDHVERLIDRLSKAQMFKEVTELRAALAEPVPPAGGKPDPIIAVLKGHLADGMNPMFSGGDLKHLIGLLEAGTRLQAEVERLKSGPPHFCGMPMSLNPHVDAGVPGRFLEVGAVRECIPCLVKSRHDWANKANALQSELTKARELLRSIYVMTYPTLTGEFRARVEACLSNQSAPAAKDGK